MSSLKTSNQNEKLLKPSIYLKKVKHKTNSNQFKENSSTKQRKHGRKSVKHSAHCNGQPFTSDSHNLSNLSNLLIQSQTTIENTYLTLAENELFASLVQKMDSSINEDGITPLSSAKMANIHKDKQLNNMVLDVLNGLSTSTEVETSFQDSILNPNEWWICQDYYNDK
eukprot:463279_1